MPELENYGRRFYPGITFLRGIAALMVALYHWTSFSGDAGTLLPGGNLVGWIGEFGSRGVHVFFVISGFVIPLSMYNGKYEFKNAFRFLLKRSIRLEPPYIASILLIILTGSYFYAKGNWDPSFPVEWKRVVWHVTYLVPFSHYGWYNIIYWTLAIEIQFYLLMTVLYLLITSEKRILIYAGISVIIGSGFLIPNDKFIFHFLPVFSVGIFLFLYHIKKINWVELLVLISCVMPLVSESFRFSTAVIVLMAGAFIHFVNLDSRFTNWLGKISYSLYLTHGLIGNKILIYLYSNSSNLIYRYSLILLALAASLLFAHFFWLLIEGPAQKLSKKIKLHL